MNPRKSQPASLPALPLPAPELAAARAALRVWAEAAYGSAWTTVSIVVTKPGGGGPDILQVARAV